MKYLYRFYCILKTTKFQIARSLYVLAGIGLIALMVWGVSHAGYWRFCAGYLTSVFHPEERGDNAAYSYHFDVPIRLQEIEKAGIKITSAQPLGTTLITSSRKPVVIDRRESIRKVVGIHPQTNTELDAELLFSYEESALNGLNEEDLILYSSTDNGRNWEPHFNSQVDTKANTLRLDGIRHFSLWTAAAAMPPDPGCITGARLWLRADAGAYNTGMVEATNGQQINTWKNWGSGATDAIPNSASQIPLLTDGAQSTAFNYNPVINTTGKFFKIPGGIIGANTFTNANVFVVTRTNTATNASVLYEPGSTYLNAHVPWGNGTVYWDAGNYGALRLTTAYTGSGGAYERPYLWSFVANGTGTSNQAILRNGTQLASKNSAVSYTGKTTNTAYIGAYPGSNYFYGDIAEVIYFPTNVSASDRMKIESYLAVKYAITLSHDYFSGGGATVWDVGASGGFDNNITGIGRDNCTSLHQKQSRSINTGQFVTIALGSTVAASNAANTANVTNDNSYLLWGDNNGSLTTVVAVGGVNATSRTARVWRVDKTNWADQTITFKAQGYGNRYLIIHNTDPAFGSAPSQEILLDANGSATFNSSLLPDGAYFSIGNPLQGPGCVHAGIALWLRSDDAPDGNLSDNTGWYDFSGNQRSFDWVFSDPSGVAGGVNYNRYLHFDGNDYLRSRISPFANALTEGDVFAVTKSTTRTGNNGNMFDFGGSSRAHHYSWSDGAIYQGFGTTDRWGVNPLTGAIPDGKAGMSWAGASIDILNWNLFNVYSKTGDWGMGWNGNLRTTNSNTVNFALAAGNEHIGAVSGWPYYGSIGEIVLYNRKLTPAERQRVNSYLALKYGLTLDQATPTDYLASNGTTKMWDATANATYKYNIAGLGRDDCQLLYQKQSTSVNPGQFITFSVGSTIAASNSQNTTSIGNDRSFLVWGDNNGSKTTTVVVSGVNVTERMSRVWRVDKTNWADQPITVKVQGYGNRYLIIHHTDPAFGTAPNQEILLSPSGTATFNSSLLPDGAYFTLGNVLQGPGCVNTGIASWYDASEMPVGNMVEGTGWTDKSGWERNMTQIGANRDPSVSDGMINFNKGAFFDGDDVVYQPSYGTSFTAGEYFAVGKTQDFANRGPLCDFGGVTGQGSFHHAWSDGGIYEGFGTNDRVGYNPNTNVVLDNTSPAFTVTGTGYQLTNWNIFNVGAATNDWLSNINGLTKVQRNSNTPKFLTSYNNSNGNMHIGWREGFYYYGNIAEVIHYNRKLTAAERQRVHSYLALKYGISLDQSLPYNYVATNGAVYWDATANATFKYNIAGIGRDDCTNLAQKQSKSVNAGQFITMAVGNAIQLSNSANTGTITNDRSFLVWGDDNGSKTASVAVSGANVTTRMTRVWRVDKTNWADQNITFRAQGYPNRYLLIHNTSATFATAPTQEIELDANGQATFNSSLLPDGAYFTIGAAIKGPGCVDVGVGSWWRADISAAVGNWEDYSGNEVNLTTVNGTVAYSTTGANYNPLFKFSNGNFQYANGIFKNSPGAINMKVFSVVVPVNGQYNAPWGERSSNGYNVALWAPWIDNISYFDAPYGFRISRPFSSNGGNYGAPNIVAGEKTPTNMALRINGKVFNQAGSYGGTYVSNTGFNYVGAQPGQSTTGNGGVAEVIVYQDGSSLTATDVQKIESYLALKYGITLDQTTPRDYLASNGTTKMWDATVNSGYKSNIAGIGRDNCQGLHQKQSKSVNPGQFITMAVGPNIFNSNAEDSLNVTNDRSFLVWGDNNGVLTNVVAVSGVNVTERSARVWRVDKTNWADQTITFKAQGYGNRYLLIHNTDPNFATAPTQEIELDANGQAAFNSNLLPDGAYFTLGNAVVGPGCVNVGVKYWLKSDYGAGTTEWSDFSGNENHAVPTGAPALTGLINFNPAYQYNNNAHSLPATADLSGNYSIFGLAKITGTSARVFESEIGNALFGYWGGRENVIYLDANPNLLTGIAATQNTNLFSVQRSSTGSGPWEFRGEGAVINSGTSSANTNWRLNIGGKQNYNEPSQVLVPEVAAYNRDLTAAEVQRVESYFALKYGLTLDQTTPQDYLASNGTTKMWDATANATYKFNIAGIGRDKCSQLHQKQSKSSNSGQFVTFALGGSIAVDNASNAENIANDRSFLVWGDDNGSKTTVVPVPGANVTERMTRVWRVDKTNWADQDITFKADGFPNRYLLIHNTSASFATAPDQEILLDATGKATFNSSALPDGAYFTIGAAIKGPGCVNNGNIGWLRGDFGLADGSLWEDYSGNDISFVQTVAGEQPAYLSGSAATNFNPGLNFVAGDNLEKTAGLLTSAGGTVIAAVLHNNVSSVWSDIYNQDVDDPTFGKYNVSANMKVFDNGVHTANDVPLAFTENKNNIATYTYANTANSYAAYMDGKLHNIPHAALPSIDAGIGYIGGENTAETWLGNIYEVAFYNRKLTAAEFQRVHSYFALKYGVTLDQTTPQDYLASDGVTKMWDATVNATHKFNIAGLGRDDCQALQQKQSRSANPGQFITMALGASIAANNAANPEGVTNDKSFFVWGDDNGSVTATVAVSGVNVTERMTRVWRVEKTNWDDQDITFQASLYPNRYLLIHHTSATFATAPTQEILLNANGEATFNSSLLPDGAYFTIGDAVKGPGCVNAGIKLWLRGDFMAAVDSWTDFSGNDRVATQTTTANQPTVASAELNFNPALNFDNTNDNLTIVNSALSGLPTGNSSRTAFTVGKLNTNTGQDFAFAYGSNAANQSFEMGNTTNRAWYENWGGAYFGTIGAYLANQTTINTWNHDNTLNPSSKGYFDGKQDWSQNITLNTVIGSNPFYIGRHNDGAAPRWWDGYIGEIIVYNRSLTAAEMQRVNSYLALKYGITIDQTTPTDYLAADGVTKMWDAAVNGTYKYDIAGIGRDNCQGLHQKQSKSVNSDALVTMGNGNTIATSNTANTNDISADKSFLTWANNNGAVSWQLTESPADRMRLIREWRVDETGTIGSVKVRVPDNSSALSSKMPAEATTLYLLVDDDGDFGSGAIEVPMTLNTTDWEADYDFNDGQYFTFATKIPPAPGCVVSGLQLWLKANQGTSSSTNGDALTSWLDQTVNTRDHTQTNASWQPKFKTNAFNFNPAVTFDGTDAMITDAFASGNEAVHVFVMSRVGDNGWRSIYGFNRDVTHVQWYNNGGANRPSVWLSANQIPSTALGIDYGITTYILPKDGSQKTIHWNGTSANIAGSNTYAFSANKMGLGSDIGNDGLSLSENFLGDIAELVIYKTGSPTTNGGRMTTNEIEKIESYLAVKYGVTLSHDYFAGSGGTIWDVGGSGGFDNNIAGIGRDDCQALVQKQTKSINAGQFITFALGNTIAADNASNSATITRDTSFFLWGDDNGSKTTVVPVSGANVTERMVRVWRVDKTNWADQQVTFQAQGFANRYLLISNSSASFATVDQEILLDANGQATFNSSVLPDGAYFTIGDAIKGPGCVNTGVKVWLRADQGAVSPTYWGDYSGQDNSPVGRGSATVTAGAVNFNPAVTFAGAVTGEAFDFSTDLFTTGNHSIAVFSVGTGTGGTILSHGANVTDQAVYVRPSTPSASFDFPNKAFSRASIPSGTRLMRSVYTAGTHTRGISYNGNAPTTNTVATLNWQSGGNGYRILGHDFVSGGNKYNGNLPEMAVYFDVDLTAVQIQRIESYFALKYGLTLDQTTPQDYLAGDGTTKMWEAAVNTGFANNIAGLGRDDCQSLVQKQSKSANTGQFVTFALGSSIAADNASNTNTITNDKSFFVWSDNNGSLTTMLPVSGANVTQRMTRVWRVDKTNWNDQDVTIQVQGYPNRYLIVHNTSATFASAPSQEIPLDANGLATFNTSLLPDGAYFTIGDAIKGPGCVNLGVTMWYRSDYGVTLSSGKVATWNDYSGNEANVSQSTASRQPTYGSSILNFNPGATFAGGADGQVLTATLNTMNGNSPYTIVAVHKPDNTSSNLFAIGNPVANQSIAYHPNYGSGTRLLYHFGDDLSGGAPRSGWQLNTFRYDALASGTDRYIYDEGKQIAANAANVNNVPASPAFSLGGYNNRTGANGEEYDGDLVEFVAYNVVLTASERNRVESYFALKYGLTLDQTTPTDYVAGDGTTKMWDATLNTGFNNDIAGLGRDDCQALHQKQSQSVNADGLVTMGHGNTIAADNASNTNGISADKSFLVWGNNNAAIAWQYTETPASRMRISREWRVQETGTVGSVRVRVPDNSSPLSSKLPPEAYPVYLLVDDDGDFSSGATEITMTLNGTDWEGDVNFTNGQYFTFSTELPPAPGCVVPNLSLWLKADAGVTGDPTVTAWADQTLNLNPITVVGAPQITSSINFNPAMALGTGKYFTTPDAAHLNPTASKVTVFAVTKPSVLAFNPILTKTDNSAWPNGFGMYGNPNQKVGFWEGDQTGTEPANVPHQLYPTTPFISTGYYDTNQKVSVNGQAATSATQTPTNSASQIEIGYGKTYQFTGDYAEVILYNEDIGSTARDKVESYLALKYGITLAHDYYSGAGTLLWDLGNTGGYDNDIAGIGRDDCDLLKQKQSKSVNASALVTIGNDNTIAASNAANTSTFTTDASFLLWGNNNGALSWQVAESPAARRRLTREWRVSEAGTIGSVKVQVPDNSSALATKLPAEVSTVYLLVDADGDFSSGATEVPMTLNGTDWEANVDLTNGHYFTFATNLPAQPGCIATNTSLWLRADLGFTPSSWADQSGLMNNATQATGANQPALAGTSNYINFNPAVDFDGTNDIMQVSASALGTNASQYTLFSVVSADAGGSVVVQEINACSNAGVNPQFTAAGDLNWHSSACVASPAATGGGLVTTQAVLNAADRNSGTGTGATWRNGTAGGTLTRDINSGSAEEIWIGGRVDGSPDNFNGRIAELALYSVQLSAADRIRVESYLAVKYGITLSHDYVNGTNATIWDVGATGGYDNDIAGIGREDCSDLNQKQSKSVNADALVTIGNGNTIATDNPANSALFTTDVSYMLWGNNDGAISWQDTEAPSQRQRLTREWLISETGTVGSVKIRIPDNSSSLTTKLPAEVLSVYLLIDNDGDFSSGATEVPMSLNGSNWEVNYDFTNGEYYTFATETCAPIITTNPVNVTVCAGGDATFTVAALGPTLSYQWQEDAGSGFANISGATSASYTKMAATGAMNGYKYRVIVNGACAPAATSTEATLTVNTPPAITTQPSAATVCEGQDATFTVSASGSGLMYQWQENTGSGFVNIPGATSASYTKAMTTAAMNGYQYQVVISGTCPSPVTSAPVALTVNTAPAITTQPVDVTVCEGTNATFTVAATGTGLTYQWRENTGSGFADIPGATSASFTKMTTTAAMNGYTYQVVVSGACSPAVTSASVQLTVNTAPAITTQPSAATVCEGTDATFTVVATGTGLTYQWQENTGSGFVNISGATSASYTKAMTTAAMNGYQYQVIISGTCPSPVTSTPVALTVNTAPAITTQPSAATVCEGQNATFTVVATGSGLTYQWQENTGSGFVNIPGATSASFTKMTTTAAMNGYQYQVIVSGVCPSAVTSTAVTLTVNTLPAITTQPSAATVCAGSDATFTVVATGSGLMYQWQENTGSGFVNIPGATSASYTKMATTAAMNGYQYQVIVSGACTPPVTSTPVSLTVNTAPAITTQPSAATVCEGQNATFTVVATGSNLTYQWQENTGSGFVNIPGATSASFTKMTTTAAMNGYQYQVIVSGVCPSAVTSTAVTLTVNTLPAITTQPSAATVCAGSDATFTVVATGSGLMYQWQENTGSGFVNIPGATSASYTKMATTAAMNGYQYQVIVSGACTPPVTSTPVALTVNTAPAITTQPSAATVCEGQNATFTVVATGSSLTYQWQENTGSGFVNIPGATSASFAKMTTTAAMNGYQYQVIVSGVCPSAVTSTAVTLTVNTLPAITTQPSAATVCAGSDATFTVVATGSGLMYQWQENTGSGFVNIAGATSASYTKAMTTAAMNGYQYQVIVSGACTPPVTSTPVALTVNTAPAITTQPSAATVCEGQNATFTVVATGTGLTYQWQEDTGGGFVNIPGATSASYTKTAVTAVLNGSQYQVIISGTCPSPVTSTPVTLTVNTLPAISVQPASATVCAGNNATFSVTATGTGLTYQWQENTGSGFVNISGATSASHTIVSATAAMNGYQYRVIVSGTCAPPVTSDAALLTVNTAPAITTQPASAAVCAGNDATFSVSATGTGLTYQWQENTGSGFVNIPGATASSYTKSSVNSSMNGYQYQVIISGTCPPPVTSSIATLTVNTLPSITAQPLNVTTCEGNNAIFTVSATGTGVTYQWQENTGSGFVNISGATGSLFIKSSVTAAMNGYQYRVIVGGTCPPTVTSNAALLTVNTAPSITTQPSPVIVCETSNATFSVSATGTGLTYQWQENTGSGFADISGATSSSYTKTAVTGAMNGYQYRVVVSGACAPPVTSNAALLTVTTAPAITAQPSDLSICAGANATFSVTASGAGLAYQWQVNDGFGFVDIPGANNATYTKVAAPASYNGYQYRVIIGGVCPPSVTSNTVTLTIQPAPAIVSQPASLTACVGSNATFTVVATGPGLSYQWQEDAGSGFVNISGATSSSYTKTGIILAMNGYKYRVLVSGNCAPTAVSNEAVMSVEAPPAITTQPANATVCEGANATFTVVATGSSLTYQWQENTGSGFVNISGATAASYTKPSVLASMSGYQYRVLVTGLCSPPTTSGSATLTVNVAPAITAQPADQVVCEGANAIFNVTATGAGLTYQWQVNTGSGFTDISGATNAAYTAATVTAAMNGWQYRVVVTGTCTPPVTSNSAFLTVNTPPVITVQPLPATACAGANATFSVTATGSGLMYQWQENTGSGFTDIPGATSGSYTKTSVTTAMNGYQYRVTISGLCAPNATSSGVALTVIEAPAITSQPSAATVCEGANATFMVAATGDGLTYQWQENTGSGFTDIPGATSASFTKMMTTAAMSGYQYRVVVSGTCTPPATSNAALLTVNTAPAITTQPSAATVCAGADATFTVVATGTGLSYQWQENTGSGFVNIPGATSASYTKAMTTAAMNGYQYQVIVSGACTPAATSTQVSLTVNTAPSITTQPSAVTLCAGANATFTVVAAGSGLTYQWQENTGSGFVDVPGATSASFTKMSVTAAMNGYQYQVVISGICTPPLTSAAVSMTVNTAPAITVQPVPVTTCEGTNATYSVTATGTGLTYQWQEDTGSGFVDIPGATASTYTKTGVTLAMSGYQYRVVVSGTCTPSVTSNAASLTVNPGLAPACDMDGDGVSDINDPDPLDPCIPNPCALLVAPKGFLGGAYDDVTGKMSDALRTMNLIPSAQPYGGSAYGDFAYFGTETIGAGVLTVTGDNAIVDWVLIELRDAVNPATVVARKAALIQRDGDVVSSSDGVSPLSFNGVTPGNYYVAFRHRNHLGVMTANAIALSGSLTPVDYTLTSTGNYQVAGPNGSPYAQELRSTGKRALWMGNMGNQSGTGNRVIYQGGNADPDEPYYRVLLDPGNTGVLPNYVVTAYDRSDGNLDGHVIYQGGNADADLPFYTVFLFPDNINALPNFIVHQQIP